MTDKCGFIDGWLECDLPEGHMGLHEDRWLGGAPRSEREASDE